MNNPSASDPTLADLLKKHEEYERTSLKLIASENYVSEAVLEAAGSVLCNKYAEGYPGARYYEGNVFVDEIENLAISRLKQLFGAEHANVQPYSGSPANQAVYRATVTLGDTIMGMPVTQGGHLTHGWKVNFSGADYNTIPYGMQEDTGRVDYDLVRETAKREQPKLIWVGGTAYPRSWDYDIMRSIADEVDAYLVADIAHISGLVAGGAHPNPVPVCDIVSSTTHKTIRGPRGGMIMSKVEDRFHAKYHPKSKFNLAKRIDRAVFPQLQGGPHLNSIAALAVALNEALQPTFSDYAHQIVTNAVALSEELIARGYKIVSGGTDTHLILVDFRDCDYSGKDVAEALALAGVITNFNQVPGDKRKPSQTSGIRIGTAAVTTMGMKAEEMKKVADYIDRGIQARNDEAALKKLGGEVREFCLQFDVPGYH